MLRTVAPRIPLRPHLPAAARLVIEQAKTNASPGERVELYVTVCQGTRERIVCPRAIRF
ncbi:MAG: hypothetical protein HY720_22580 [Planctomycetes bacterium]|nr:hypothetical protein [Planctomycetota bacterium]